MENFMEQILHIFGMVISIKCYYKNDNLDISYY